jgi:ferredoxin
MTYRIVIDQSLCSGFGTCAELAPEVFKLEGGVAALRVGTSDDEGVFDAADSCPMGAISIELVEAA